MVPSAEHLPYSYFLPCLTLNPRVTLRRPEGKRRVHPQATLMSLRFIWLVTVRVEKFTLTSSDIRERCRLRTWTCLILVLPVFSLTLRRRQSPAILKTCRLGRIPQRDPRQLSTLLARNRGTRTIWMSPGAPGLATILWFPSSRQDPATESSFPLKLKLVGARVSSLFLWTLY